MTKSQNTKDEQLTEGSYVYTDLGIEQVHWCEVNGEKELVTPKGYIHGDVPSVNRHFQLVGENAILIAENTKLKELLKECRDILLVDEMNARAQYKKALQGLLTKINQVLGEE